MLQKSTLKKLSELKWLDIMKHDSNAPQTWNRIRNSANKAISQLKLLADVLPDKEQGQIFDYGNIRQLVSSMLGQPVWIDSNYDLFDARRTRLAAILAEESLNKCITRYTTIEDSPAIAELSVAHLQKSIEICKGIASKVESKERESETKQLMYLFTWNNPYSTDDKKIIKYLKKEFNLDWLDTAKIQKHDRTITITNEEKNGSFPYISIGLNEQGTGARLSVYNKFGNEEYSKDLIVKLEDNDNLNVYAKKNKTYNRKSKSAS
jgi:uncharacterized protein YhbP (UPF0306 family)